MKYIEQQNKTQIKLIAIPVVLVIGLILFFIFKPFTTIGAGQRGVVMHFGQVQDRVLGEGLSWYMPIITSVKTINVRVQKDEVKAEAASKDLQDVHMDVVVNYHIDPTKVNKVFQQVGDNHDVFEKIINPNTNEVVKAATSEFTAEEIIKKRQELKHNIDVRLIERLVSYGVVLDDVSLTNIDFSAEFNAAIEAKQVAEQQSQQARYIAEKAIKDAEAIVNKAKGDAEAQKLQQQSLSPEFLQKIAIEKWNGVLPNYLLTNTIPFVNIGGK